jgi:hypothetical protein
VCAYRDEKDIPETATPPTFAALRLKLDSWPWAGVPFYLRSGKRLPRKLTEITVHFKPTPHLMFPIEDPQRLQHNILTFRLQPDEGILHTFLAKQPGPDICLRPVTMNFRYDTTFGIEEPPAPTNGCCPMPGTAIKRCFHAPIGSTRPGPSWIRSSNSGKPNLHKISPTTPLNGRHHLQRHPCRLHLLPQGENVLWHLPTRREDNGFLCHNVLHAVLTPAS